MAEVLAGAVPAGTTAGRREISRSRAVRRFKWMILLPLVLLLFSLLTPVLLLQLFFSFHQWTVYLSSWWSADFVGFDIFKNVFTDPRFGWAVLRSLAFAGGSTIGCFVFENPARLSGLSPVPRSGALLRAVHPADADRADRDRLYGADAARPQRAAQRYPVAR